MQVCPHCNKENSLKDTYCYACGHILPSALNLEGTTNQLRDVYESIEPQRRWGTAYFDRQNTLKLNVRDTGDMLEVELNGKIVVGRLHEKNTPVIPHVDLTPYGAVEKGVSRAHLELSRDHDTVIVTDLGSSNSTYLNGQRIMPFEPRILRDNDELRLGHLVLRVAFI